MHHRFGGGLVVREAVQQLAADGSGFGDQTGGEIEAHLRALELRTRRIERRRALERHGCPGNVALMPQQMPAVDVKLRNIGCAREGTVDRVKRRFRAAS